MGENSSTEYKRELTDGLEKEGGETLLGEERPTSSKETRCNNNVELGEKTDSRLGEKWGGKLGEKYGKNWKRPVLEKRIIIVETISEHASITSAELAAISGISTTAVDNHLKVLKDEKIICRIGPDKGGHWHILEEL